MAKTSKQSSASSTEQSAHASAEKSVKIPIDGKDYEPGDTLTFLGEQVTALAFKHLTASAKSGVTAGTYPVVQTILQPGDRKVYRAIINGELYPIREYGQEGETISKIRAKRRSRVQRSTDGHDDGAANGSAGHILSDVAEQVLSEYLAIESGKEGDTVLSGLVVKHLRPEVEKAKAAAATVRRLPADILALLGGAGEDAYEKIRRALGAG